MRNYIVVLLLFSAVNGFCQQKPSGIYYEIFVRSFSDSDGDGVGDIKGITQKLDYLRDLGVSGLWLTPVHPSSTYHKYDVLDYKDIDKEYGTLGDYKELVREAHARGIKILLDLVVNHTGSEHPWFKASCGNDKTYKDYYVWSDTATTHGWYSNPKNPQRKYYAFFWERMPDLNFDHPQVRKDIIDAGQFWVREMGIDGFRLDAAQHVYEPDDVVKNNVWWSEFRSAMRSVNPNVFLVGEVWNKDSIVATYLKSSLDASFNFDLSGAITRAIKDTNATGFIDKLLAIHTLYRSYNPDFVDAIFVSNHDQDRYCSTFDGNEQKTKQAFMILMTLPGIPFIYYGEELGMLGKWPDEYRREPFLWGASDAHTTTWEKPKYSQASKIHALDQQADDPGSYYKYYQSVIALRKAHPVFELGVLQKTANLANDKTTIAYELKRAHQTFLVIHNVDVSEKSINLPAFKKVIYGKGVKAGKTAVPAHGTLIVELK